MNEEVASLLDARTAAVLLRTLVREERARADRLASAAAMDGLIPTPWAVLREIADQVERVADALDADGRRAVAGEGAAQ